MEVSSLIVTDSYSSNSYVLRDGDQSLVIDPGMDMKKITERIEELGLAPDRIVLTHCHYDHTAVTNELRNRFGAKVLAHPKCAEILETENEDLMRSRTFGRQPFRIPVDEKINEGNKIRIGKTELEVLFTPGHTQGCICLYGPESKSLFSGDTVFAEGIGRYDLPTGDVNELKESLKRLSELHEKRGIKDVYPGHGPPGKGENIEKIYDLYFGKRI